MKRLIDADVLYMRLVKMKDFGELTAKKAIRVVEEASTIDAEHVLRCHACRFFHIFESGSTICTHPAGMLRPVPDGFCNYAEPKESEE
jgi:hypothetical protein